MGNQTTYERGSSQRQLEEVISKCRNYTEFARLAAKNNKTDNCMYCFYIHKTTDGRVAYLPESHFKECKIVSRFWREYRHGKPGENKNVFNRHQPRNRKKPQPPKPHVPKPKPHVPKPQPPKPQPPPVPSNPAPKHHVRNMLRAQRRGRRK